jgi:uncharacterized protein
MIRSWLPGEVPEWSKGADCKSVGSAFEGSNPSLPKRLSLQQREPFFVHFFRSGFSQPTHSSVCEGWRIMNEPFYADGLRFECTGCSNCCRHEPGYVFLTAADLSTLSAELDVTREEFVGTYCRSIDLGGFSRLSLTEKSNYDCVFWRDGGCGVYEARPLQCRTYPFWSSSLGGADDWAQLASECPGANRGRLYSCDEIDELLKQRQGEPLLEGSGQ